MPEPITIHCVDRKADKIRASVEEVTNRIVMQTSYGRDDSESRAVFLKDDEARALFIWLGKYLHGA